MHDVRDRLDFPGYDLPIVGSRFARGAADVNLGEAADRREAAQQLEGDSATENELKLWRARARTHSRSRAKPLGPLPAPPFVSTRSTRSNPFSSRRAAIGSRTDSKARWNVTRLPPLASTTCRTSAHRRAVDTAPQTRPSTGRSASAFALLRTDAGLRGPTTCEMVWRTITRTGMRTRDSTASMRSNGGVNPPAARSRTSSIRSRRRFPLRPRRQ